MSWEYRYTCLGSNIEFIDKKYDSQCLLFPPQEKNSKHLIEEASSSSRFFSSSDIQIWGDFFIFSVGVVEVTDQSS